MGAPPWTIDPSMKYAPGYYTDAVMRDLAHERKVQALAALKTQLGASTLTMVHHQPSLRPLRRCQDCGSLASVKGLCHPCYSRRWRRQTLE